MWRPWTLWLPCVLAFAWSGLLFAAHTLGAVLNNLETNPQPAQSWLTKALTGDGVLAGVSILLLVVGLRFPTWRQACAIAAWMVIPAGLAWVVFMRSVSGS
jgi:hypothetical protein